MPLPVWTVDAETDPFLHNRVPEPFLWGIYTGREYFTFEGQNCTEEFIKFLTVKRVLVYAHNGGRFDFMFLLKYLNDTRLKIINNRLAEIRIGETTFRDSWSIIPTPLAAFQKTKIDYTKFESSVRHNYIDEIREYLKDDLRDLYKIVQTFRSSAGSGLTIAGNALRFARKLGIEPGATNAKFDRKFRLYYFGGRCQAFNAGHFQNIDIFDIKSAYPWAMIHEHPIGKEYIRHRSGEIPSNKQLCRSMVSVECYSRGAFPIRKQHKLEFPHEYNLYHITGWELACALKYGLIDRSRQFKIHECREFINTINFKPYVDHWFNEKEIAESRHDKANRHVAKIMLNSLYGKFAQNPVVFKDYKVMPAGSKLIDGWQLGPNFGNKEFHCRDSLYELKQKYGDEWEQRPAFYNVATAASITGFVRAMLLQAMATVGADKVLYCDTDSLFIANGDYAGLRRDGKLGAWGWDGRADDCYVAGRKLYIAYGDSIKDGIKKASKGARLTNRQIEKAAMGETVIWKSDAPTFSIDGRPRFIVRKIRRTQLAINPNNQ